VEASDEAGHAKDLDLKIRCIEYLDQRLIKHIITGLGENNNNTVIALLPDHPTPVSCGAHTRDPVPFAIWNPNKEPDSVQNFNEETGVG